MATQLTCILFALEREAMFFRRALPFRQAVRGAPCSAWLAGSEETPILVLVTGMGSVASERALGWVLGASNPTGQRGRKNPSPQPPPRSGEGEPDRSNPILGKHFGLLAPPLRFGEGVGGRGCFSHTQPSLVISAGFCGALSDGIEIGALLRPDEMVDAEGHIFPVTPASASLVGLPCRLATVSRPVLALDARESLQKQSGAVVVDMESLAAARLCQERGVPFLSLRCVSDDGRTTISPALAAVLDGEHISLYRLAWAVLRRPWLVRELIVLARQSRIAAAALANGLQQLLEAKIRDGSISGSKRG